MVILLATQDRPAGEALAEFLKRHTSHLVLTAWNVESIIELVNEAHSIDLLLCAADFSNTDGWAVHEGVTQKFPNIATGFLCRGAAESSSFSAQGHPVFSGETQFYDVLEYVHRCEQAGLGVGSTNTHPLMPRSPASLEGMVLGDYEVREKRRDFERTESYLAFQISMQRLVVLERLKPEFQHDPAARKAFRALVRTRAKVEHAGIATVYEAQETPEGDIFYTRELIRGSSLADCERDALKLSSETVAQMIRIAAEAVVFYQSNGMAHGRMGPQEVFAAEDGVCRTVNIALPEPPTEQEEAADIEVFADYAGAVVDAPPAPLQVLLQRMRGEGAAPIREWKELLGQARVVIQQLQDFRTAPPTPRPTGKLRRRRRLFVPVLIVGIVAAILGTAVALLYHKFTPPARRQTDGMVRIPAGEFLQGDGQKLMMPEFWIDRHEVSIAHYADFLAALGAEPKKYDHPDQPPEKNSHKPPGWEEIHAAAKQGATYRGQPITLNSPIFYVDWWDAHAYAAWKGRRLPTEQEWEKAARGLKGSPWPWGDSSSPAKANTGDDFHEDPKLGGKTDGAAFWCDVDAKTEDRSPFGVVGMGGNVAEWTSTWDQHPDNIEKQSPVYRGGSFSFKNAPVAAQRWVAKAPEYTQPFLGFRTASDKAP